MSLALVGAFSCNPPQENKVKPNIVFIFIDDMGWKEDWKLLQFHEEWVLDGGRENLTENNAVELYNLADDIGEAKNLAATETDKREELLNDLIKWQEEIDAPVPREINPEYEGKGI